MSKFDPVLRDEYLRRVALVNDAVVSLEQWLGGMSSRKRLTFLQEDPVTNDGKAVVVCDEDLIAEMEENARIDDEE